MRKLQPAPPRPLRNCGRTHTHPTHPTHRAARAQAIDPALIRSHHGNISNVLLYHGTRSCFCPGAPADYVSLIYTIEVPVDQGVRGFAAALEAIRMAAALARPVAARAAAHGSVAPGAAPAAAAPPAGAAAEAPAGVAAPSDMEVDGVGDGGGAGGAGEPPAAAPPPTGAAGEAGAPANAAGGGGAQADAAAAQKLLRASLMSALRQLGARAAGDVAAAAQQPAVVEQMLGALKACRSELVQNPELCACVDKAVTNAFAAAATEGGRDVSRAFFVHDPAIMRCVHAFCAVRDLHAGKLTHADLGGVEGYAKCLVQVGRRARAWLDSDAVAALAAATIQRLAHPHPPRPRPLQALNVRAVGDQLRVHHGKRGANTRQWHEECAQHGWCAAHTSRPWLGAPPLTKPRRHARASAAHSLPSSQARHPRRERGGTRQRGCHLVRRGARLRPRGGERAARPMARCFHGGWGAG